MSIDWSLIDEGRMKRSEDVKINAIDHSAECADFLGSGNSVYAATLENCTCTDFQRSPYRPCKHIIRLARELGKFDALCNQQLSIDLTEAEDSTEAKRPGKKHHVCRALSDYVVIDLEATDRNTSKAGIIELAAVHVKDNHVVDTFSTLANPGIKNTPGAYAVNHISDEMIESAPPIADALKSFLDFVGNLPVVGHNISSFDI